MSQLDIEHAGKTYAQSGGLLCALTPINLHVAAGEFLCIVGPSGCGKSTLLSLIAGLEDLSSGTIWVNGQPVTGPGTDRVLIFQEGALFPWLDVQGNVEFGLRQAGVPPKQRREIAERYIDMVHLRGFERSFMHQLSGGMRQRTAIARALALDPAVLLMDEPFGALDALTRDRLYAELESIWESTGKTIVFVTHNVREAVLLGDRVVVFSARPGRIVGEFPIDLPRSRSMQDHALADRASAILTCLEGNLAESVA